jgi:hypothetical protein
MRLERHRQRGPTMGARHLQGGGNHRAMAEMDAVEITHRDHRPLGDRGRGGVIADNRKARRHFKDSSTKAGSGAGP